MKRLVLAGLLAGLLAATPVAAAGVGEGNGEIGVDLGYTDFDADVTGESGTLFSVRGGYHFTKIFELEGQLADATADESGVDFTLTRFMVNGVFNFHPGNKAIVPYVLAGIGTATLDVDLGFGSVDDSDLAYQVAVGSRFFFGKRGRVALRIELSSLSEGTFDETSTHTSFGVGVTWALGQGQ